MLQYSYYKLIIIRNKLQGQINFNMPQDHHHKGSNGRYYKDKSRKYYQSPYNYSYSSYSSNPNPFPSNQQQQQQQQQQQLQQNQDTNHPTEQIPSNPFSSRRNDLSSNKNITQSSSNEPIKNDFNSSNNSWYNTPPSKRNLSYRSSRPSSIPNNSSINLSNSNRRNMSDSYRDDQSQLYPDYNNKYNSYPHHDSYSTIPHKNQSFNKSKYYSKHLISNTTSSSIGNKNNNDDYRDFSSFQPKFSQPSLIPSAKKSFLESTTKVKKHDDKSDHVETKTVRLIENEDENSTENKNPIDLTTSENATVSTNINAKAGSSAEINADVSAKADPHADSGINAKVDVIPAANTKADSDPNEIKTNAEINDLKDSNADQVEEKNQVDISDHVENIHNTLTPHNDDKPTVNSPESEDMFIKSEELNETESTVPINVPVDIPNEIKDDINEPNIQEDKALTNQNNNIKSEIEEVQLSTKYNDSNDETVKYSDVQGCIFPMLEKQYRAWELKHTPKSIRRKNLTYLNKSRLTNISQYNFIDKSFLVFKQADAYILFNNLKNLSSTVESKKKKLTDQYVYLNHLWKKDIEVYDKQLEKVYENEDNDKKLNDSTQKTQQESQKQQDQSSKTSSRRSRHHGDSVRTEAEFMEILATLEQEREKDPLVRAQYGAAIIPDMIMDPVEKYGLTRYMDSNNLVKDKTSWANRIYTDPVDTFTEAEHNKFCELYAFHPKKFGRISRDMGGLRTSEECVLHYYKTKKTTNYKQLVANRNKRPKRKVLKKKKDSKSKTKTETATPETSNIENDNQTNDDDLNISNTNILDSNEVTPSIPLQDEVPVPVSVSVADQVSLEPLPSVSVEPTIAIHQRKISIDDDHLNTKRRKTSDTIISQSPPVFNATSENKPQSPIPQNIPQPVIVETSTPSSFDYNDELLQSQQQEELKRNKRTKRKDEEKLISSYWSVQDINVFPTLLQKFGSSWEEIAQRLGTKSATMVKNFYRRGLVEHPEWQTFVQLNKQTTEIPPTTSLPPLTQPTSQPQEIHKPVSQDHTVLNQNGPSMGYFYKPANAYSATYAKPPLMQFSHFGQFNPQQQQPQQQQVLLPEENSYVQHIPQFVPIDQSAPHYRYYVNEPYPNSHLSAPQPPIQIPSTGPKPPPLQVGNAFPPPGRSSIMNMTSLLNSSNSSGAPLPPITSNHGPSSISQTPQSSVPLVPNIKTEPVGKRQNIMNLLNEDTTNIKNDPIYRRTTPFKPNISNIMNSSPIQIKNEINNGSNAYQPEQPKAQKEQKPNFIGGTSALDALAQIAFERK